MSSIKWSIQNGDLEQVRQVVSSDNVNIIVEGRTPLHFAADYGQQNVADYLVSIGADALDQHGITPILAAIWENHRSVVQFLLSKGARTDMKAPDGSSYVDCAEHADIRTLLSATNCV